MKRDKNKGAQADRHALLAAAALQDHLARRLRMPGGPVVQPSLQPGAPMTLAQHLGLVPRPAPLLTEDEWTEVHLRSRLRQDSAHECVICREEFQAGAQVLLSCSHTFHRHCLASFERYSRSKTCPLCRAQQYQKKVIGDGAEIYRTRAATRIQAAWRCFAARRKYLSYRRHNPPRDPKLRKKWAAERLQEENDRLLSAMDDEVGDLDDLFAELDASVAQSRAVCDAALRPLAARLQRDMQREEAAEAEAEAGGSRGGARRRPGSGRRGGGGDDDEGEESTSGRTAAGVAPLPLFEYGIVAPGLMRPWIGGGGGGAGAAAAAAAAGASTSSSSAGRPATAAEVDWDAVVARARSRGSQDCPICLGNISRRGSEGIAWLSCTHCFHVDCIMAFEAFELASGGTPSCPVCRSGYRRRCFA